MKNDEYRIAVDGVIYLCRCAVNDITPNWKIIKQYNFSNLYEAAERHMISAMTGMALKDAGTNDPAFNLAIAAAQRKVVILNEEIWSFEKLSEAGIWHMALKGTIIRDWYPKYAMRESADCDILFDKTREDDVRNIMIGLSYSVENYGRGHHDVYMKKPLTNMQMHVELFGVGFEKRLNEYYENIGEEQKIIVNITKITYNGKINV